MDKTLLRFSGLALTMWLSLIGTQLTDFSLGIWVYQKEESAALYGLIGFAIVFPQLAFSPLIGKYVDRYDHRKLMMLGHFGSGLCTILLITLFRFELLTAWTVALVAAIAAMCNCLVALTFNASIVYQVEPKHLARVQGIVQAGLGVAQIGVPIISAFLISTVGMESVFLIDIASFSIVLLYLSIIRLQRRSGGAVKAGRPRRLSLTRALVLFKRPQISLLIRYGVVLSFTMGVVQVLIPPLMLDIANVTDLGILVSVSGTGMVVGSGLMALRGERANIMNNLLWSCLLVGALMVVSPVVVIGNTGFYILMAGAFFMMFCFSLASGYSHTMWVKTIPEQLQGRVFGFRNVALGVSYAAALLLSGFVVDYILKPMLVVFEKEYNIVMNSAIPAYFAVIGLFVMLFAVYFSRRIAVNSPKQESVTADKVKVAVSQNL